MQEVWGKWKGPKERFVEGARRSKVRSLEGDREDCCGTKRRNMEEKKVKEGNDQLKRK